MTASSARYVTLAPPSQPARDNVVQVRPERHSNLRASVNARSNQIRAVIRDRDRAGFITSAEDIAYCFATTRMSVASGRAFKAVMSERADPETGEIIRRPLRTKTGKRVYIPYRVSGRDSELHETIAADLRSLNRPDDRTLVENAIRHVDRENRARQSSGLITGDALAAILHVTWEQRQRLGLSTFGSIDRPKSQRVAASKEVKRSRDRNAQRAKRELAECLPRQVWEERHSDNRLHPWKRLGMSRATWFRKGKPRPPETGSRVRQVPRDGEASLLNIEARDLSHQNEPHSASPSPRAGGGDPTAPAAKQRSTAPAPEPASSRARRKSSIFQLEFWPQLTLSAGATATARLEIEPQPGPSRRRKNQDVRESSQATHLSREAAA